MGGVGEGAKEERWQGATAKFRAPSSQDFPVAERTEGTAGDSAACLGVGVSEGAADPDLDLGGPRRGGEAGAPPRPRPAAAAACRPSSGGGCGCWSDDGSSSRSFRCPLGTPRDAARRRGRCGRRDFGVGGGR